MCELSFFEVDFSLKNSLVYLNRFAAMALVILSGHTQMVKSTVHSYIEMMYFNWYICNLDPYKNREKYWIEGFGQLTNVTKNSAFIKRRSDRFKMLLN